MQSTFQRHIALIGLLGAVLCMQALAVAQNSDPALAALEHEFALHYLEPEPHMALAKYHFDHGNKWTAFVISEEARRGRFEEKVFGAAFYHAFDGFDNSPAAEAKALADYQRDPNNPQTIHALADIYVSREDYEKAKQYLNEGVRKQPDNYVLVGGLVEILSLQGDQASANALEKTFMDKFPETEDGFDLRIGRLIETNPAAAESLLTAALKKFPNSGKLLFKQANLYHKRQDPRTKAAYIRAAEVATDMEMVQTWAGRYFFKSEPDYPRALRYYFNAYFLNPHAYETEYVESRIPKIAFQLAEIELNKRSKSGVPFTRAFADPDPVIVSTALGQADEKWSPQFVQPLTALLGHYDPAVRAQATELLKMHVDSSFDDTLKALLADSDPRKRGLAAYIAVYRWKEKSFPFLRTLLADESELVRFDAISALMIDGGPQGQQLAREHAARETNPTLKKLILTRRGEQ